MGGAKSIDSQACLTASYDDAEKESMFCLDTVRRDWEKEGRCYLILLKLYLRIGKPSAQENPNPGSSQIQPRGASRLPETGPPRGVDSSSLFRGR